QPLGGAEVRAVHGAFIPEHHQAATFAPIPADDAGTRDAFPVGHGCHHAPVPAAGPDIRQGAAVLLPAAPSADPLAGNGPVLRAIRRGALDVRITRSRPLPVHSAARLGIFAAGCLY